MKLSTSKKWIMITLLAFFGRAIANVPYLREVYYDQVLAALQISNTQLGILSSAVGIASLFGYFFGGFLADRISSKKLIIAASILGGLSTLWYAAYPPFPVLVVIHALIALAGTLLFWSAYVRIIRILGGKEGQGKYYGFAEGIRATIGILLPMLCTLILSQSAGAAMGIRRVLIFYAVCYFLTAVLAWFLLVDIKDETSSDTPQKVHAGEYLTLLKNPGLWLVSFLIFGTYTVFSLQSYSTPYMTGIGGLSDTFVSTIATFRQYGVGLLAMPLFGILADNVFKSSAKTCAVGALLLIPCILGILICPANATLFLVALVLIIGFLAQGIRGVYYATQDEAKIPVHLSGAAAGIISTIGFLPDAFIFTQVGAWLDSYPADQAYRMIWIYMIVGALVALGCALGILRLSKKRKREF
ncbi:MAG: MFS transporter [Eubacterium sp.]|nr:MFS transporter [Eubacterium sp.]